LLEKLPCQLKDGVSVILESGVKWDVKETGGATQTLVMTPKLYDSKWPVRFPVTFKTFKYVNTSGHSFATDVKSSFFPETQSASHGNVFRFLQLDDD
jgi:hypothetical protein